MNSSYKPTKKQIESFLRVLGLCCIAFALYNQLSKPDPEHSQDLTFWLAISSVVFLTISYNITTGGRFRGGFLRRNKVIIPLLAVTLLLVILWIVTNYILFRH